MATSQDFIESVCQSIMDCGAVRYKKMFGEYMVYADEKPILLVCDNTVFVKILPALETVMSDAKIGVPYQGSKPHYILDVSNAALAEKVVKILIEVTPVPKKRKK